MAGETNCNNFIPSPEQVKMAEALANPEETRTDEQLCNDLGVSRTTLWRWKQKPEFRQYVNDLVSQYTDSAVPKAWRALISRMGNDTQAIKLFFELKNMYKDRKELSGEVVIFQGDDNLED